MLVSVAAGLAVLAVEQKPWLPSALEGGCHVIMLLFLASRPQVHAFLRSLSRPHRITAGAMLGCCLVAQLIVHSRSSFPFVAWDMYCRPVETTDITFYEYRGITSAGETIVLAPAGILQGLGNRFPAHLDALTGQAFGLIAAGEGHVAGFDDTRQQLHDTLVAIGQGYNRQHPRQLVKEVRVAQGRLDTLERPRPQTHWREVFSIQLPTVRR